MKEINLEQGSQAWLDWRKTGIGSSDAPSIMNLSPWKSRKDLWEEKVFDYHKNKTVLTNRQMEIIIEKMKTKELQNESAKNRGKKLEDVCRKKYENLVGYEVIPFCGFHDSYEFLKVSLDGWNKDKNLFVEIKCPNQKTHEIAIAGQVVDYYVPQLLHQFVITEAPKCHYVSYHDRYPPGQQLVIVEVTKENAKETLQGNTDLSLDELIEIMKQEMIDFWNSILTAEYKE